MFRPNLSHMYFELLYVSHRLSVRFWKAMDRHASERPITFVHMCNSLRKPCPCRFRILSHVNTYQLVIGKGFVRKARARAGRGMYNQPCDVMGGRKLFLGKRLPVSESSCVFLDLKVTRTTGTDAHTGSTRRARTPLLRYLCVLSTRPGSNVHNFALISPWCERLYRFTGYCATPAMSATELR